MWGTYAVASAGGARAREVSGWRDARVAVAAGSAAHDRAGGYAAASESTASPDPPWWTVVGRVVWETSAASEECCAIRTAGWTPAAPAEEGCEEDGTSSRAAKSATNSAEDTRRAWRANCVLMSRPA
jgi:hypothetical protein